MTTEEKPEIGTNKKSWEKPSIKQVSAIKRVRGGAYLFVLEDPDYRPS